MEASKSPSLKSRFRKWLFLSPTSLILAKFFFFMFAFGAIISAWVPTFKDSSNFPALGQPERGILGFCLLVILFISVFYIPDKYCLFTIYFFSAIRISDALYGGPAISAFLWFGAALICTYSVHRADLMDRVIDKRIEEKQKGTYDGLY